MTNRRRQALPRVEQGAQHSPLQEALFTFAGTNFAEIDERDEALRQVEEAIDQYATTESLQAEVDPKFQALMDTAAAVVLDQSTILPPSPSWGTNPFHGVGAIVAVGRSGKILGAVNSLGEKASAVTKVYGTELSAAMLKKTVRAIWLSEVYPARKRSINKIDHVEAVTGENYYLGGHIESALSYNGDSTVAFGASGAEFALPYKLSVLGMRRATRQLFQQSGGVACVFETAALTPEFDGNPTWSDRATALQLVDTLAGQGDLMFAKEVARLVRESRFAPEGIMNRETTPVHVREPGELSILRSLH